MADNNLAESVKKSGVKEEDLWVHIELDHKVANVQAGNVLSGHVYMNIGVKPDNEIKALTLSFIGLE